MADSTCVNPGYAEGNFGKQAYIGNDVYNTMIAFSNIAGGIDQIQNNQSYSYYFFTNAFYLGGKQFHPASKYDLVANPTLPDVDFSAGPAYVNAPSVISYVSRSNDFSDSTQFHSNATPDGTAVNPSIETVSTYRGVGTYAIGIGSGSRHIKVQNNFVRLPDLFYQATGTGWNAGAVIRYIDVAAPTSGSWSQGDIVFNSAPTTGGFIGWVCVATGTPGTWKTFGAISV